MQEFFYKIVFALIAGVSEFLPVSAPAHQLLYQYITNRQAEPLLLLVVHIGCLAACLVCCGKRIRRLRNEKKLAVKIRRRRGRQPDPAALMDAALLRTAAIPMILGYLCYRAAAGWMKSLAWLALSLAVGGILLFIPQFFGRCNKDGRSLSRMDGLLTGMGGMLGVLPGMSRVGCAYSMGLCRGAEHSYTMEMVLMLSIPALSVMIIFDIYAVAVVGAGITALALLGYLSAALLSFAGGYLTIALIRYFAGKVDVSGFAYYSWGLALFTLLIYLIIH